jgi:hypothetical protein
VVVMVMVVSGGVGIGDGVLASGGGVTERH